ncbi:MAG: hypothetical protein E7274_05660 [Pseudobutyrivibrio ruminis]|uniref:hypothetical protein n=1 Tax=Pseudobutyrivibrio ruminis TaxID=46206 RepID=UPI0026F0DF73|nr:hypothetical protein [Pseudobutyrivibrio ruminis]MBE5913528.1 hypothetical protein [Pseudobutyrivibrio ruminis]
MEELTVLLNNVPDSYFDFVSAMVHYAQKKQSRLDALLNFLNSNPDVSSSDIVKFVSEQADFFEDAAYMSAS